MSYVVGLTGGIGSGKSAAGDLFAQRGIVVIDTDAIAHSLTTPGGGAMAAIEAEFGASVMSINGSLNRAAMRTLAFADPTARKRLEAILHPMILGEGERQIAAADHSPYTILMVPLLIEAGNYRQRVHRIAVVDCREATQIMRVQQRNGLALSEIERIMAAQASRSERLAAADDVIDNEGTPAALLPQIERLHLAYLGFSQELG